MILIKMFKCKEELWLEDITQLFCNYSMVPLDGMGLAAQMNSITRLVIVVFVVLLLLDFKNSLLFLLLSLLFIIILYYIQRKQMDNRTTENFTRDDGFHLKAAYAQERRKAVKEPSVVMSLIVEKPHSKSLCAPLTLIEPNNPKFVTETQKRVGPANPKTFIPPVVIAGPSDDYWRGNNLTYRSVINERTNFDTARSGYQVTTCCGNIEDEACPDIEIPDSYYRESVAQYAEPSCPPPGQVPYGTQKPKAPQEVKEYFNDVPYLKTVDDGGQPAMVVCDNQPGWVNTSCGYNPEQLPVSGLPANYGVGNCRMNPAMKEHNEAVFTQTIQPGVYMRSDVNEPINSNIGISFTQQNQPVEMVTDPSTGDVLFIEQDPRLACNQKTKYAKCKGADVTENDVYDPRYSGYGTSYRAYSDEFLGQTKFYYDDVNAIRMPNYITRNNIDHTTFGDTYGPLPAGSAQGNPSTKDIRALANQTFLNSTLSHRNDIQFSLMRKNNNMNWQQRVAPISTQQR
jgi:hypothetical protein